MQWRQPLKFELIYIFLSSINIKRFRWFS
jgi:hypothetical protein